ncbi:MAG: 2OG-Fe(II) oxygenase [Legionellales bacterium]|nr:2OG-Fe(II) oxygenase [Legionellales bacterium]
MNKLAVVDYTASNVGENAILSLKQYGFLVLDNTSVPQDLIDACYDAWYQFFQSTDKYNYLYSNQLHDGFRPIEQAESAKGTNIRDLKEMYHYYPNGRCPDYLADITQRVFQELYLLARQVLAWIEQGLPSSVQSNLSCALSDMIVDSPNTLYRLLHYPPLTGHEAKGTIRAAAHADICLLTVLPAATAKGLQILTRQGEWIDVPVKKSSMIINIGDMLQECTHAFYPSTQHRVINPDHVDMNQSRLSMPLFLHPADDVVLSDQYTALSYRMERLGELGLL